MQPRASIPEAWHNSVLADATEERYATSPELDLSQGPYRLGVLTRETGEPEDGRARVWCRLDEALERLSYKNTRKLCGKRGKSFRSEGEVRSFSLRMTLLPTPSFQ
jgi:hypothetical protein